ncbi:unnamed protein product [Closterium sp. Naga37s-1]|nr:unnamed protein product [Closterium sp. Naga37s-1]
MRQSKILVALLALSLLVSLALAPCRADEMVAEDDADANVSDVADLADASPSGALTHFFPTDVLYLMSKMFGATRRFLWSSEMHRMLSCKSDCEEKNKECNTDYSECKRENKDDEHKHHKCSHTYKKCKKKAKKCRSKCD